MRERIRGVISEVFAVPADQLPETVSIETLEDWDSLHHLELMLALEMEFGVQISSEVMPDLLSLDAIDDYLQGQGNTAST
jgi:acyl carrier protein